MSEWVSEWVDRCETRNDTDRGRRKYSDKNPSQFHIIRQQSGTDWPEIELSPAQWDAG